ncbi:MAG: aconitase X catalytic domain-containing protein [Pseudomonadota bacterium]
MKLADEEQAMLAGEAGRARKLALEHQLKVGRFLGAADMVPVSQAHVMADTESLGEAGIVWLEALAALPAAERRVRVPTITDPRGTDFERAKDLKQQDWMLALERRAIAAFQALGVLMTDTCINYQTIMPPVRGEHVALCDTGVVIYSNSVLGARSNFEGGPSAVSAGLTGRTPRYGYHLDEKRRASLHIQVDWTPRRLDEWGALGALVGRLAGNYWAVPVLSGSRPCRARTRSSISARRPPASARWRCSIIVGITPEAERLADVCDAAQPIAARFGEADIRALQASYGDGDSGIDLVVFSTPQLSLVEMDQLASLCDGRRFKVPVLAITSPQVKPDADRAGLTARIEGAGGMVLSGMCFYQSYAREMAEANGWRRLATNSAKLVNIIGGYGYVPRLASMAACLDAAETGRLA